MGIKRRIGVRGVVVEGILGKRVRLGLEDFVIVVLEEKEIAVYTLGELARLDLR